MQNAQKEFYQATAIIPKYNRCWYIHIMYIFTTVEQMRQMESGYVFEVLHYFLKDRFGTQLITLAVDLVDADNEASLELLCALFKHRECYGTICQSSQIQLINGNHSMHMHFMLNMHYTLWEFSLATGVQFISGIHQLMFFSIQHIELFDKVQLCAAYTHSNIDLIHTCVPCYLEYYRHYLNLTFIYRH